MPIFNCIRRSVNKSISTLMRKSQKNKRRHTRRHRLLQHIRHKLRSIRSMRSISMARTYQKKYRILCVSAMLLWNPIIFYLISSDKNLCESMLMCLLIGIIITSLIFWANPVKKSRAHLVDGVLVKSSILLYILYIVFLKKLPLHTVCMFILIVVCIGVAYYYSNMFSNVDWCCEKHIKVHTLVHFFGSIGAMFAFM
jgi:hypothetical protein